MPHTILEVFGKIREISTTGLNPRPFIDIQTLEYELRAGVESFGPCLLQLKKMRLIIFDKKVASAVKLTALGLHWDMMPR